MGHYWELGQDTDLAFQSTMTWFYFSCTFFFLKGGWLSWYRSEYRCENSHVGKTERVRQWTVGTARETAWWRNTLDQKYSKQRCGIEPLPFAIFNWSKHRTWKCLTNWGRGENKKGFCVVFLLLLCHTGAFYSESSTHQETEPCFLCVEKLSSYFSL